MSISGPALDPLQQSPPSPPPLEISQQTYTSNLGHGSVGPVIGVLAVVTILGAIAVMIGRLCSGRRIMGRGQYDVESWAETKCASCIDGRVDPSPPPPPPHVVAERRVRSSAADAPPPEERDEEGNDNNRQHERSQS